MSFRPNMTSETSGIGLLAPLTWRELPGVVTDVWQVAVSRGGSGTYSAPDPRIVAVLGADESEMRLAHGESRRSQPIRIAYIPAGLETRASFRKAGRLAHLDVHFSAAELSARLRDAGVQDDAEGQGGAAPALEALIHAPRLMASSARAARLAEQMADEIRASHFSRSALDAVLGDLIAAVFAPDAAMAPAMRGGLTAGQIARVDRLMRDELHRPLPVAEMAGRIGLSESWFAHAWAQSRGEPPHRSLHRLRIERAKLLLEAGGQSLASIAIDAGFADQAHFTRSFRKQTGATPGLWRRHLQPGTGAADPAQSGPDAVAKSRQF